ncbi:DegT/DnrJ/EryC1/StrS family aminotransferase [Cryobacterium mannosilyticum]|uniref:DegT/DnrJ/EryC1/StrS family aminotransferase n=1 Tax=Cryobacterium mannosilyticum TaxID=1259190 RepID=A0A4R8W2J1_9MICO|nr:DegT/DnrJ/EryC1/StrS family aminotransferase [Cryobacterium mannosilyticum]TFC01230.1 DegT/DnrJ/EryC1/StrS family aminotransferase [Cryobacterium mannosilyticum]
MISVPFFDLGKLTRSQTVDLHACLDEVLDGGYFVGGPLTQRFEAEFANFVGAEHCVGTGNGLDSIRLILEAYGVGPGDEVIVPAFTFYATWLGVTQTGAIPVPVDVSPATANLDPTRIEQAITGRTKAIIAVHLYGQAADLSSIMRVAKEHGLIVVEDAAQSHGAVSNAGVTGAVGDAAAFSFYPTKNLGALGDAGCVTTSDANVAARIRSRRSYGQGMAKYDHIDTGWNSRLDPLQAAFLSYHLRSLDLWTQTRREIAGAYYEALGGRTGSVIGPLNLLDSVWHHFVVKASNRAALQDYLALNGVASDAHYPYAVHELAPMRALLSEEGLAGVFPAAVALSQQVTSLPMGPWMSSEQIDHVAAVLREIPDRLLTV